MRCWGEIRLLWRALRQVVSGITKPTVLFSIWPYFHLDPTAEHQITSYAAREWAPPSRRTDYLSWRPQFVRLKNRLSVALMRSAKTCNAESRPAATVPWWLWWSINGQRRGEELKEESVFWCLERLKVQTVSNLKSQISEEKKPKMFFPAHRLHRRISAPPDA